MFVFMYNIHKGTFVSVNKLFLWEDSNDKRTEKTAISTIFNRYDIISITD